MSWFDGAVAERIEIELELDDGRGSVRRRRPGAAAPVDGPRADEAGSDGADRSPSPATDRRRVAAVVAAAALLSGAVGWTLGRSGGDDGETTARAATSTTAVTTTAVPTTTTFPGGLDQGTVLPRFPGQADPTRTTTPGTRGPGDFPGTIVTRLELGRQLLPVPTGLELVGLTPDGAVARLVLDTGELTVVPVDDPRVARFPTAFRVLSWGDDVLLVDQGEGRSVVVGADGLTTVARGQLGEMLGGPFPGPTEDLLWVPSMADEQTGRLRLDLVGRDGPVGEGLVLPATNAWVVGSDHVGGVLIHASGGTYRVTAAADGQEVTASRLTTGELLLAGSGYALVRDCDDRLACGVSIVRYDGESTRRLDDPALDDPTLFPWAPHLPTVAPTGDAFVWMGDSILGSGRGPRQYVLVDEWAGATTGLGSLETSPPAFGWSADGRFLLYTDGGKLFAVDRPLRTYTPIDERLPLLWSFALRPVGD
jgi:hypothetical protein